MSNYYISIALLDVDVNIIYFILLAAISEVRANDALLVMAGTIILNQNYGTLAEVVDYFDVFSYKVVFWVRFLLEFS